MYAHDNRLVDRNVVLTPLRRSSDLPGLSSHGGVPSSGASLHLARKTSGTTLGAWGAPNAAHVGHRHVRRSAPPAETIGMVAGTERG